MHGPVIRLFNNSKHITAITSPSQSDFTHLHHKELVVDKPGTTPMYGQLIL